MFDKLQEQAAEAQERWDEIGKLSEELEELIKPNGSIEGTSRCTARLVLLLVTQFKPKMDSKDTKALEEGLKNLLGQLTSATTGGSKYGE